VLLTGARSTRATAAALVASDRWCGLAVAALTLAAAVFDLSLARNHLLGISGDDALYRNLAGALASGRGFVDLNLPWAPPETSVPPGFPVILAPLVALTSAHSPLLQVVPLLAGVAAVPLIFVYLRELDLSRPLALTGAALLAANPSVGLYATIVMPETTFVTMLLVLLLMIRRWMRVPALSAAGAGAVIAAVALFELKLAAVLLLAPLALAVVAAGRRAHGIVLAAAVAVAALPLLALRLASGTSPAGSTYDADFTNVFGGLHGASLALALAGSIARNVAVLLFPTLSETLIGIGPGPLVGGKAALLAAGTRDAILALVALVMLTGAWGLWRRTRDVGLLAVSGYLLVVTVYPIMNTRRTILVAPVLVACLVVGATDVWRWLAERARTATRTPGRWQTAAAILAVAVVAVPVAADDVHHLRDYRSDWNVNLLADRPWLRYLSEQAQPDSLVEVIYPTQVYLGTGVHTDGSLWSACAISHNEGSRRPFDDVLTRLRPQFVVAAGTPQDCVPDLIRGDPQYIRVLLDAADHVVIWELAA
jgi:hypothetical protein